MDLEQKTLSYLLVASKKAYLLQILTKNASELFFDRKNPKKKSAGEKSNVGDCLKRGLPGSRAMAGQFKGVNGRLKFTPPPSEARSERSEVVRTYELVSLEINKLLRTTGCDLAGITCQS